MQTSADLDRALGAEPNFVAYGRGVEATGEMAFRSLPPIAVASGVHTMVNAENGWQFAGGLTEATLGAIPLALAARAELVAARSEMAAIRNHARIVDESPAGLRFNDIDGEFGPINQPSIRSPSSANGDFNGPWRDLPPDNFNWKAYMEAETGTTAPIGMPDPHAHHVLPKRGRPAQRTLIAEGQDILRRRGGIDPIYGTQNLTWAPNRVVGQHSTATIRGTVERLRELEAAGASAEDFARVLKELGDAAANRR